MAEHEIQKVVFDEMGAPEDNGRKYIASVDASSGDDFTAVCLAMVTAAKEFIVMFCRTVTAAAKEISSFLDAVICVYPNRRVAHLAKYHSSERVRKKNRKRILKWIERG